MHECQQLLPLLSKCCLFSSAFSYSFTCTMDLGTEQPPDSCLKPPKTYCPTNALNLSFLNSELTQERAFEGR